MDPDKLPDFSASFSQFSKDDAAVPTDDDEQGQAPAGEGHDGEDVRGADPAAGDAGDGEDAGEGGAEAGSGSDGDGEGDGSEAVDDSSTSGDGDGDDDGTQAPSDGDGGADASGGEAADDGESKPKLGEDGQSDGDDRSDDVLDRLAELLERKPEGEQQQQEAPKESEAEQPPLYDDKEMKVLEDYEKNWPDVAQAEGLRRRAEYHDLLKFAFEQVHAYYQPHMELLHALANRTHLDDITTAVPGYNEEMYGEVENWIGEQKPYLQAAYKQVMENGTAEEVADLLNRFQEETGRVKPQQKPDPEPSTELSGDAKQAAQSLAPVRSKRTAVPKSQDEGDFSGTFARLSKDEDESL